MQSLIKLLPVLGVPCVNWTRSIHEKIIFICAAIILKKLQFIKCKQHAKCLVFRACFFNTNVPLSWFLNQSTLVLRGLIKSVLVDLIECCNILFMPNPVKIFSCFFQDFHKILSPTSDILVKTKAIQLWVRSLYYLTQILTKIFDKTLQRSY